MNNPAPSTVPDTPFATLSSSGVRDSSGSRAPWVGRVNPIVHAAIAAAHVDDEGWQPKEHARRGRAERERLDE